MLNTPAIQITVNPIDIKNIPANNIERGNFAKNIPPKIIAPKTNIIIPTPEKNIKIKPFLIWPL